MDSEPIHFSKAVLPRNKCGIKGELRGEDNNDLTAQECWVKLDKRNNSQR